MNQDTNPNDWVSEYGDALYRFALMRVNDVDSAQDLVQDTFIAGIHSLPSFKGDSNIKTWLTAILKHKILDYYRKQKREISESQLQVADGFENDSLMDHFFAKNGGWKLKPETWESDAESILMEKQKGYYINQCLDKLSPKYKNIFVLKEIDDMSSEEVCKTTGVSSSNLWVLLHRSRLQLRKCLENIINNHGAI